MNDMEQLAKKLFKDKHYGSYIEVVREEEEKFFGKCYVLYAPDKRDLVGAPYFKCMDASPKVYKKSMHIWENFDASKLISANRVKCQY